MNNIEVAYQNALMSDATYIDFDQDGFLSDSDNDGYRRILNEAEKDFKKRGFTDEQFKSFQDQYKISHYEFDEGSGFDAVIFVDTYNDDKKTIAFRGTEGPGTNGNYDLGDFFEDIMLGFGFSGLTKWLAGALTIETLVEYFEENNMENAAKYTEFLGGFSQTYDQEKFLKKAGLIDENGQKVEGLDTVNITGHSLGGNLALQATYDFQSLVDKTYTFNGAGDAFLDILGIPKELRTEDITNYVATPGWEVTAGQIGEDNGLIPSVFVREGTRQGLFIENQARDFRPDTQAGNHSMYHIVNSLSVMRLLEAADPSVDLASANQYLHAASNLKVETTNDDGTSGGDSPAETLDTVMTHLANFLGGRYQGLTTTNDAENFYSLLTGKDGDRIYGLDGEYLSSLGIQVNRRVSVNLMMAA